MGSISDWHLDPTEVTMQKHTLELRKYAAQFGMGQTTLDRMELEARKDFLTDTVLYQISTDLLSSKIAEDTQEAKYSYQLYTTPWQMFKDWYMPTWFKAKFPAKKTPQHGTVKVKFERYGVYPKANVAIRKDQKFFDVMLGGHEAIHDSVVQVK